VATLVLLFLFFFGMIVMRVPVAVALGVASMVGMVIAGLDIVNAVTQLYRGLDVFVILAVPFFLAVGFLATRTSIGDRLLEFSAFLTGRIRGAVGHLNVVVSMLFAGISGSATADTSGVGAVLIPMMRERGYSVQYAAAITAQSSVIGSIIPPSLIMIIYGAYAQVSVGALFAAGIVPGLLCGAGYMVFNYFHARKHDIDQGTRSTLIEVPVLSTEVPSATRPLHGVGPAGEGVEPTVVQVERPTFVRLLGRALPPLMVPFILLGGITGGVFTATEAGLIALVYLLVLATVFYRDIGLRDIMLTARDAVEFYSLPLLAAGMATVFGFVVTVLGAPNIVRGLVQDLSLTAPVFLLLVIMVFIVVGTFLDAFPAIVLFAPIFIPGALELGVHPLQLAIVIVMTLALGLVTPPYGLCLLIASKLADIPAASVTRAMLPFWGITLTVIAVCVLAPDVVLALPEVLYPALFR
jgi:TRAP-type C4-dicarboxylate transport system permease large subunit